MRLQTERDDIAKLQEAKRLVDEVRDSMGYWAQPLTLDFVNETACSLNRAVYWAKKTLLNDERRAVEHARRQK